MSVCTAVTKVVLNIETTYNPDAIMKRLAKRKKFEQLKTQLLLKDEEQKKHWVAIVEYIYRHSATPIAKSEAEGILDLFLRGDNASIQILAFAGIIKVDPPG